MPPFFPTTDYYQAVNNNEQFWSECQSLSDFVLGAEYSLWNKGDETKGRSVCRGTRTASVTVWSLNLAIPRKAWPSLSSFLGNDESKQGGGDHQ